MKSLQRILVLPLPLSISIEKSTVVPPTLSVFKLAQYYSSRTPRWGNLSNAQIIVFFKSYMLVPINITNYFKILDLAVNRSCKVHLRKSTQSGVAVQKQLENEKQPENVKIDTRLNFSHPLYAKWIASLYFFIKNNKQVS